MTSTEAEAISAPPFLTNGTSAEDVDASEIADLIMSDVALTALLEHEATARAKILHIMAENMTGRAIRGLADEEVGTFHESFFLAKFVEGR